METYDGSMRQRVLLIGLLLGAVAVGADPIPRFEAWLEASGIDRRTAIHALEMTGDARAVPLLEAWSDAAGRETWATRVSARMSAARLAKDGTMPIDRIVSVPAGPEREQLLSEALSRRMLDQRAVAQARLWPGWTDAERMALAWYTFRDTSGVDDVPWLVEQLDAAEPMRSATAAVLLNEIDDERGHAWLIRLSGSSTPGPRDREKLQAVFTLAQSQPSKRLVSLSLMFRPVHDDRPNAADWLGIALRAGYPNAALDWRSMFAAGDARERAELVAIAVLAAGVVPEEVVVTLREATEPWASATGHWLRLVQSEEPMSEARWSAWFATAPPAVVEAVSRWLGTERAMRDPADRFAQASVRQCLQAGGDATSWPAGPASLGDWLRHDPTRRDTMLAGWIAERDAASVGDLVLVATGWPAGVGSATKRALLAIEPIDLPDAVAPSLAAACALLLAELPGGAMTPTQRQRLQRLRDSPESPIALGLPGERFEALRVRAAWRLVWDEAGR